MDETTGSGHGADQNEVTARSPVSDHSNQSLSAREMVRAHAYPLLAALSTLSLISITILLVPQAVRHHRFNRCIDAQVSLRDAINPGTQQGPGKINYLKAVEHCTGQ